MRTMQLRTAETLHLTPELTAEVGNQLALLDLGHASTHSLAPFAGLRWTRGDLSARYVVSSTPQLSNADSLARESSLAHLASLRSGSAALERGLHQELKFEQSSDLVAASVAFYQDEITDPFVDGTGPEDAAAQVDDLLLDRGNGTIRVSGNGYNSRGVVLEVSGKGPASTRASVQVASGSALSYSASNAQHEGNKVAFTPAAAQAVSVRLEGASVQAGTNWRASYRWQSESTVNAVDLFDAGLADAYLSLFLKQSLHLGRVFPSGVDAVVDVRNLLAQGYHPYLTADGSRLFFAQANRSVNGGLVFYF